ncbi:GTP-binding protein REM 1-like [Limulus polyphemus]|uniref:GTP-binding protein REM 1-like n=1 Tax=Limulus polyphemus TaxID=6850 RepID=A0ABM1SHR5_LIMPO|nr:GTP-binding protein REM 1-like [Limulus polyphemus]
MPVIAQNFLTRFLSPRHLTSSSRRSTPNLRALDDSQDFVRREASPTLIPPIIFLPDDADTPASDHLDMCPPLLDKSYQQGIKRSQSMRNPRRPESAGYLRERIASISDDSSVLPHKSFPFRSSSNHSLPLPSDEAKFLHLPFSRDEAEMQRLRNFSVTSKGVVNRGDSFRSKSRSTHSVSSTGSRHSLSTTPPRTPSFELFLQEAPEVPPVVVTDTEVHRVLVVGAPEVGKSSLTTQFTTSEYICAYDNSHDGENEKSVTVILNEEESELVFVECDAQTFLDQEKDAPGSTSNYDAYIVVYSVTDKRSFRESREILNHLMTKEGASSNKAAILVGNKTDLARLRNVSTKEGRALANDHTWKFIETSTGINHHVDELLVGILSQIRLKCQHRERLKKQRESDTLMVPGFFSFCSTSKTKVFVKRILEKAVLKSRSCDNLHVL